MVENDFNDFPNLVIFESALEQQTASMRQDEQLVYYAVRQSSGKINQFQ